MKPQIEIFERNIINTLVIGKINGIEITVERRCNNGWCVRYSGQVLNSQEEWEWEPSPSNREDSFIKRTRFDMQHAIHLGRKYLAKLISTISE